MSIEEARERRRRVVELTQQGRSAAEIARELGVNSRIVVRHRSAAGVARQKAPLLTAEERDWIAAARADGMPSTWIAETIGCHPGLVHRIAQLGEEEVSAWRSEWLRIRRNPVLLALHREFAPPTRRSARSARVA